MKLSPSLISVKRIVPQVPVTSFSEDEIAQVARLILEAEGIINPIIVKRTSLESYEVIAGDFEYYAAARARELNPRRGEKIGAFIVEEETENVLREQVKYFRNQRGSSQPDLIEPNESNTNQKLDILLKKMEQSDERLKNIENFILELSRRILKSEEPDYEKMTVKQLKQIAKDKEIKFKSNITKPELIKLIKTNDKN